MGKVKQAVGLQKKKPKETAPQRATRSANTIGNGVIMHPKDLDKQIALLETVTRKLAKNHTRGDAAGQVAAKEVNDAAERIKGNLDDAITRLGPAYASAKRRLLRVQAENQLILDEKLVSSTRAQAEAIYVKSGQDAAGDKTPAASPLGFKNLTSAARTVGFKGEHGGVAIHAAGAALGLSPAELAAINTFTNEDYRYMNPATANDDKWMKINNREFGLENLDKAVLDENEKAELAQGLKDAGLTGPQALARRTAALSSKKEEGALHAGMALQGLMKLPVWTGKLYRAEVLTQEDFDKKFKTKGQEFVSRQRSYTRNTISSASKDRSKAQMFWGIAGMRVKSPKVSILHEWDVTNGRDIETISSNTTEKEVAILPGATFAVTATEANRIAATGYLTSVTVKAKQRK